MRRRTLPVVALLLPAVGCVDSKGAGLDLGSPSVDNADFEDAADVDSFSAAFADPAVQALDNTPADNPITDAGATLGRALFYDPRLSANETVSCASCHQQEHAFADPAVLSLGFDGGETARHGMPLVNLRWVASGAMFWDERAPTLEDQVLGPIQDEVEMGMSLDELEARLASIPEYDALFAAAFGDTTASADRVARSLAQFVRALASTDSPYDAGLAAAGGDPRPDFAGLSAAENRGKALFFGPAGCAACHTAVGLQPGERPSQASVFFLDRAANNGLDLDSSADPGVGGVTGDARDDGRFKSPSLRNVAVTGPYMHDGRLETLADVVEHYRSGVQPHPNLDPRLQQNGATRLTDAEADDLVAFLETLTDEAFLDDDRFADPWER